MDILKKCDLIIDELNKFASNLTAFGDPILDDRLIAFENKISYLLPGDFKYLLTQFNGFSLYGTEVYGIDESLRGSSLDKVYDFEHSANYYKEMPDYLVPFSPDGRGNHYCLVLSKSTLSYPIAFWQHDLPYQSFDEVEICNNSFVEWVEEVMIRWTLEDYNYDGTEK